MKKIFLAWQNPESRSWFPVGCLEFNDGKYHFYYICGVKKAISESGFQALHSFPNLEQIYTSTELFPIFSNRLMPLSRPDYQDYLQYLNISQEENNPINILARSGGRKATDNFEVFSLPDIDEHGVYHTHFFVHGLRYMPESSIELVKHLKIKEHLYLTQDFQNIHDRKALLLRTENHYNVGYCPRYLATDIFEVLNQNPQLARISVERINLAPTPIQFRLLCTMTAQWKQDFVPFDSQDYKSITDHSLVIA